MEKQRIMSQWQNNSTEVLIVGAGPAGLMMACQLAVHQISFRIIDKNEYPASNSGALILQARSLEIFEQMGIAGEAMVEGMIARKVNVVYNGLKISTISINDIGKTLSKFPFILMLEQSKTEKLFLKFIQERGYCVERRTLFKSLTQDEGGVISVVLLPDGSEQSIKTKYVIAADGYKSAIRNYLNIPFKGKTYQKPLFILDCKAKTDITRDEICFAFSHSSVSGFFPLPDFRWRIDSTIPKEIEKIETITFKHIEKDFHLWTKMNVIFLGNEWFSILYSHRKSAGSMQNRNCFLVGDAAHVHTPVGAQGMNTGLQDAYNLGWKLAYVLKNKAKPDLLETFTPERSDISKGFANSADILFQFITSRNLFLRFFRFCLLKMLFKFFFPLLEKQKAFRQIFFRSISQIDIHYRYSGLSDGSLNGKFLSEAPRPGDRLPYVEFFFKGRNTNNYDLMDSRCFNLFVFGKVLKVEFKKIAEKYNLGLIFITYHPQTIKMYESLGIKKSGYFLIRPDNHISLRSAALDTSPLDKFLKKYLIVQ